MNTNENSLFNKKAADLTVADSLKIQAGLLAVMAAIPVVIYGAQVAQVAVSNWRYNRKVKQLEKANETK